MCDYFIKYICFYHIVVVGHTVQETVVADIVVVGSIGLEMVVQAVSYSASV
ncbi:hypothetical protein [Bacillus sp. X1(2014)]|uniref:hypothetical protein n=1 Tax=Bacillus sp. X1(2014) TaxID=1565991 RepID=UPI0021B20940|nr:hypothetical protein [Bacillus sp. X1(2014)]